MDQTVSEYVANREESPSSSDGGSAPLYEVEYRTTDDAVIVESRFDEFSCSIRDLDIDSSYDIPEYPDEIHSRVGELREFEESHNVSEIVEFFIANSVLSTGGVPFEHELFVDHGTIGVTVRTEIDGNRYAFETGVRRDEEITDVDMDAFEVGLSTHIEQMDEIVMENEIHDRVTLDQDDE